MSGLDLREMEASNMLDVIHYLFEEDNRYQTGEEAEAKSKFRSSIYRELYNTEYKYGYSDPSKKRQYIDDLEPADSDEQESIATPFNPRQSSTKPFIKPTNPDELGNVLDGSLN